MIYQLDDGSCVDTNLELNFDERNFIQKMMIYRYLKISPEDFRARWRRPGNPVWTGPATLNHPTPAARILLDMEKKLRSE